MFARRISQSILRQTSACFTFNAQSVNINYMTRCFGAAARKTSFEPSTEVENEDMIRDYIKGLMDKQQEDQVALKPISDEDLQQRLDHFQALLNEATSCIADCQEARSEVAREVEGKNASESIDQAFAAYIDLLEDLRRANDTQKEHYRNVREQCATSLKQLRRKFDAIGGNAPP